MKHLIKLDRKQHRQLTNFILRLFKPEHKHRGIENGYTIEKIRSLSGKFLEEKRIISKTLKVENHFQYIIELTRLVRTILYSKLMNPRNDEWFVQGLISQKVGRRAYFYYPKNDNELSGARATYQNRTEAETCYQMN